MNKRGFLITVLTVSLIGAILFPLIGVWFPQIREICDWAGFTIIAILAITLIKEENK